MPSAGQEFIMTGRGYRTERAVKAHPMYDVIHIGRTGSRLHVVHPIPDDFPWEKLSAEEREDVYKHVEEIIRYDEAGRDFMDAVKVTKGILEAARDDVPTTVSAITTTTNTSTTMDRTIPGTNVRSSQRVVLRTPTMNAEISIVPTMILEEDDSPRQRQINAWQDDIEAGRAPPSNVSSPSSREETFYTAQSNHTPPPSPTPRSRRPATGIMSRARVLANPPVTRTTEFMTLERRLNDLNDTIDGNEHPEALHGIRQAMRAAREALFQARSSSDDSQVGLIDVRLLVGNVERVAAEQMATARNRASTSSQTPPFQPAHTTQESSTERRISQLEDLTHNLLLQPPNSGLQWPRDSHSVAASDVEEIRPRQAAEEARSRYRRPLTPPPPDQTPLQSPAVRSLRHPPSTSRAVSYQVVSQVDALYAQNDLLQQNAMERIDLHWVGHAARSVCRCPVPVTVHGFGSATLVRNSDIQARCTEFFRLNPTELRCDAEQWEAMW